MKNELIKKLVQILRDKKVTLNMVDLGASSDLYAPYLDLIKTTNILRFDPDLRDVRETNAEAGFKCVTINKAVVEDDKEFVDLYLTDFPYCSSTLKPDFTKLSKYEYLDLFKIKSIEKLPAINLNKALQENNIDSVDWIKLDTQGTEGRILKSIDSVYFDKIVYCDVEASVYAHYEGADTLPGIHDFMISKGFWIVSNVQHKRQRGKKETIEYVKNNLSAQQNKIYSLNKQKGMTSVEIIYLRTIESAEELGFTEQEWLKLFTAHFYSKAYDYCIEINNKIEALFGDNTTKVALENIVFEGISKQVKDNSWPYYKSALKSRLSRVFK